MLGKGEREAFSGGKSNIHPFIPLLPLPSSAVPLTTPSRSGRKPGRVDFYIALSVMSFISHSDRARYPTFTVEALNWTKPREDQSLS